MTITLPLTTDTDYQTITRDFLSSVFSGVEGQMWLARRLGRNRSTWREVPFAYPTDLDRALAFVDLYRDSQNLYVCTTLSGSTVSRTELVGLATAVWADLDFADPGKLAVAPSVLVATSPGRHQAWWVLDTPVPAVLAVSQAAAIAHAHKSDGCDVFGGLGKMMRLPGTLNFNYPEPFEVRVLP